MSDLSRLLDDLYATTEPESDTTRAPEWSSTEALDEVFSTWVPGSLDAEQSEHAEPVAVLDVDDTWLDATEPAPITPPRWSPSDDDILPARGARRRGRRLRRGRSFL